MDQTELKHLVQDATKSLEGNNYVDALAATYKIKTLGSNPLVSYYSSGLLIDIGNALGQLNLVEEGKELLEKHFPEIVSVVELAPTAYYNLANAFLCKFNLQTALAHKASLFSIESPLEKAKSLYRRALTYKNENKEFQAQVFVNLGNCLDYLGRVVEALECYDDSLRLKPDFGMALGNKAKSLLFYANLCGEHQNTFRLEAYSLLNSASKGVTSEAEALFSNLMSQIEASGQKLPLKKPPKFPGHTITGKSKLEKYVINFCLQNRIYLNVCNFCQKCDASIGDSVVIREMTVQSNYINQYLVLSSYLNEIKQDFVAARLLLILSRYPGLNLELFDKRVALVDTMDQSINNIYLQLLKTSFKTFYDVLDKIAFFVNDYLNLGIREEFVSFSNIWHVDKKAKYVTKKIVDTGNVSLNALFSVPNDLDCEYRALKDTRNILTHRFLKIQNKEKLNGEKGMTEDRLFEQTLELSRLVRSSIIYLLQTINIEESKRLSEIKRPNRKIIARTIPDRLKNRKKI